MTYYLKKGSLVGSLLLLTLGLLFMSCDKKKDASSRENETASGESELAGNTDEPVTISLWHSMTDDRRSGWIKERGDEWNASQDKYRIETVAKGYYRESLNDAILAARQGQPPHLVHVYDIGSQLAFDSGIFVSVEELGKIDFSDYLEAVINYYTIEGKINSIPFNSSSPILFVNKDLMSKAGLDPENPPLIFEDMIALLEKSKAAGMEEAGFGFNVHSWFFEQWIAQQGGTLVNNGNGRQGRATEVLLNSPEMLKIVGLLKTLNDKGLYKYTGKLEDWDGSDAIFTEGKVMFHMSSSSNVGNILKAIGGKFEIDTAFMPVPKDVVRNGVALGGGSLWVTKDHPQDELVAAREFAMFLTNTENIARWHQFTGYYPVRQSSIDLLKNEGWFEENPVFIKAFDQLMGTKVNVATAGALLGNFLDLRANLSEGIQRVLNGDEPGPVLDEANKKVNAKLDEYNQNIAAQ